MVTVEKLQTRLDAILSDKTCQSASYSRIGRSATRLNQDIVKLSNVRAALNEGWSLGMLHTTECMIKQYES